MLRITTRIKLMMPERNNPVGTEDLLRGSPGISASDESSHGDEGAEGASFSKVSGHLEHSVRTGSPAIEAIESGSVWAYFQGRPEESKIFWAGDDCQGGCRHRLGPWFLARSLVPRLVLAAVCAGS
jgi:hypothetical protein